jgi:hypothetical protein
VVVPELSLTHVRYGNSCRMRNGEAPRPELPTPHGQKSVCRFTCKWGSSFKGLMMQAVGKQFNLRLWMKWWMYMNQPNAVFPQVHCERQLSMWHMYFYVILCLNVVMFNISFVFEIFASHPQPPNEGLGVPCPKPGTATCFANPMLSKVCICLCCFFSEGHLTQN